MNGFEWHAQRREQDFRINRRVFRQVSRSSRHKQRGCLLFAGRINIDSELVAISAELNKPREKPKMSSAERQKMLRDQERSLADYRFLSRHINQLFQA